MRFTFIVSLSSFHSPITPVRFLNLSSLGVNCEHQVSKFGENFQDFVDQFH